MEQEGAVGEPVVKDPENTEYNVYLRQRSGPLSIRRRDDLQHMRVHVSRRRYRREGRQQGLISFRIAQTYIYTAQTDTHTEREKGSVRNVHTGQNHNTEASPHCDKRTHVGQESLIRLGFGMHHTRREWHKGGCGGPGRRTGGMGRYGIHHFHVWSRVRGNRTRLPQCNSVNVWKCRGEERSGVHSLRLV